jgi:hypothetical protein
MNRLHEKGFIGNPVGKAKSVVMTPGGCRKARELFEKLFVKHRIKKNVGEQVGACLKRG